jgi:oligopeptide/dipeptide ABC transporter ATP-binding protein
VTTPLLAAREVSKDYPGRAGARPVRAVDTVSLVVQRGETLGLVGESGCGKSTLGRLLLGLEAPTSGTVHFEGHPVEARNPRALRPLRRRMQVVFQDPYSALNPRMTVGDAIAEGLVIHRLCARREMARRVAELMTEVGLNPADAGRYPHEFSGGQRQRIGIARALAVDPDLLICDEPVSALDVSVQAQVLNLLADLQQTRGLAMLFIAHDLAVVRQLAHRVAVMYLGRIVEVGPADQVIGRPAHPYTRALLSAVPGNGATGRIILAGDPPSPSAPPPGCAFASRCYHARRDQRCEAERPALRPWDSSLVACHYTEY